MRPESPPRRARAGRRRLTCACALALLAALAAPALAQTEHEVPADWSLKPDAVAVGGTFRLLFVSSTTRDGTSTDIADYNAHVQTAAAAGHADIQDYSAGFAAIGSTSAVNARDNTGTTASDTDAPIYWLSETTDRSAVATGYADFYDGTWGDTSARTETGASTGFGGNNEAITGTTSDGRTSTSQLGHVASVRTWRLTGSNVATRAIAATTERRLLALSPIFTVVDENEVPADWSLKPDAVAVRRHVPPAVRQLDHARRHLHRHRRLQHAHVQTAAAAGHADIQDYSAGFAAIGSTSAVNARDNTGTTASDTDALIYWLSETTDRSAVATGYADFYDGTWGDTSARTETGASTGFGGNNEAITGTTSDGRTSTSQLGHVASVRTWRLTGSSVATRAIAATTERRLLALSPIFTVAADATLSGLVVNDGTADLTLVPEFAATTTEYRTSVSNGVSQVTVTPTKGDAGATIAWLDADDMMLDDADTNADDFQVDLDEGANTFKIEVTAADTTTTETYTVVVTRAAACPDEPPSGARR